MLCLLIPKVGSETGVLFHSIVQSDALLVYPNWLAATRVNTYYQNVAAHTVHTNGFANNNLCSRCWFSYTYLSYFWILEGPRTAVIVVSWHADFFFFFWGGGCCFFVHIWTAFWMPFSFQREPWLFPLNSLFYKGTAQTATRQHQYIQVFIIRIYPTLNINTSIMWPV